VKRKIILGLVLHTLVFLVAGGYLALEIRGATVDMERVLRLHDVELLREDFLVRLHEVQLTLARGERAAQGAVLTDDDAATLERSITACFGCHHSDEDSARLVALRDGTRRLRAALDEARSGPGSAAEAAFVQGEEMVARVLEMVDVTHQRLEARTMVVMRGVASTRYVAYALFLFGPLLSAVLGLVALRSLTRPLDTLREATHRLRHGDLDHRVEGLEAEFGELADSFNAMAESLKNQMQLMQRTEQLVVVGEMAAGLVHEIKNPLAGIKAAVQVLGREASLSEEDRDVLVRVGREVVGLEALLRSFLEFARPARPQLAEVDVNAFVESTTAFYLRSHAQAPGRPLRIVKSLATVPPALTDPMQLQQILLNLLLNAVDAMPEGGNIEVRTGHDERAGTVHVEIADAGRGIRPEHAARVFEPFFTTKPGGTGLGLAVSKRLAEQHGGSLEFVANPGGGTTFRIELPVAERASERRSA